MKMWKPILLMCAVIFVLTACAATRSDAGSTSVENNILQTESTTKNEASNSNVDIEASKIMESEGIMKIKIGSTEFEIELEDNQAVQELKEMVKESPVEIQMQDYSGFEKVGSLGRRLTTSNQQTTTKSGDIVLYNGNQIVIFYGSNSWSYTRLGHVKELTGWTEALGRGDVNVTFVIDNTK